MKKRFLAAMIFASLLAAPAALGQCSICTRTAQQLGEQPAKGLNQGILYLAFTPFAIAGYVGYRWWRNNR
ncbi:MAG TPA: hypothetical protein VG870_07500 [Chitinophagaceae bacterium]|nr:hypothetical protein [Chitinophagaceae bacterium]